jgi:hypothetical protein
MLIQSARRRIRIQRSLPMRNKRYSAVLAGPRYRVSIVHTAVVYHACDFPELIFDCKTNAIEDSEWLAEMDVLGVEASDFFAVCGRLPTRIA